MLFGAFLLEVGGGGGGLGGAIVLIIDFNILEPAQYPLSVHD